MLEDNLFNANRNELITLLKHTATQDLWAVFLKRQSELFFPEEWKWISKGMWWKKATSILEIGSGNGAFLHALSLKMPGKKWHGLELQSEFVAQAMQNYGCDDLSFEQGNAEQFYPHFVDHFDLVIFRLALQHMHEPLKALKHAAQYVHQKGVIVIIDSFDQSYETSHPIIAIQEAFKEIADKQKSKKLSNRRISFDIFNMIQNRKAPKLSNLAVLDSNLDSNGKVVGDRIIFKGKEAKQQFLSHTIIFAELLNRTYQIKLNLDEVYEQLSCYEKDQNAWTSPGAHFLVLKKECKS